MPLTPPMPLDEGLVIQDTTTKTATFSSAAFDLGAGFDPGGVGRPVAVVANVTARDATTGDETYSHKLEESDDGSTGWADCSIPKTIPATGISFSAGYATKRYLRHTVTLGGTTPSLAYKSWLAFRLP